MRDGLYVSLGRISRRGRSYLASIDACMSDTRVERSGCSFCDTTNSYKYFIYNYKLFIKFAKIKHNYSQNNKICSNFKLYYCILKYLKLGTIIIELIIN
jgi:hypothetical protein